MTERDRRSFPWKLFLQEWGKSAAGLIAIVLVMSVLLITFIAFNFLPLYVGAYVELGVVPWEIEGLPVFGELMPWTAANIVWSLILISGVAAGMKVADSDGDANEN